jgi:hypothetical protein
MVNQIKQKLQEPQTTKAGAYNQFPIIPSHHFDPKHAPVVNLEVPQINIDL